VYAFLQNAAWSTTRSWCFRAARLPTRPGGAEEINDADNDERAGRLPAETGPNRLREYAGVTGMHRVGRRVRPMGGTGVK